MKAQPWDCQTLVILYVHLYMTCNLYIRVCTDSESCTPTCPSSLRHTVTVCVVSLSLSVCVCVCVCARMRVTVPVPVSVCVCKADLSNLHYVMKEWCFLNYNVIYLRYFYWWNQYCGSFPVQNMERDFLYAAERGDLNEGNLLVERGCPVNAKNEVSYTPACMHYQWRTRYLLRIMPSQAWYAPCYPQPLTW